MPRPGKSRFSVSAGTAQTGLTPRLWCDPTKRIGRNAKTKTQNEGEKKCAKPPVSITDALINVVDLLVESRISDAMDQILVKTNPVAHELYLARLRICEPKTAELNRVLTQTLESQPTES